MASTIAIFITGLEFYQAWGADTLRAKQKAVPRPHRFSLARP
jgi:hypothetical protein